MAKSTRAAKSNKPSRPKTHSPDAPSTIIGLDIGYGYVKVLQPNHDPICFPSVVAPKEQGLDLGLYTGHGTITVDHTEFLVGEDAFTASHRLTEQIDSWWTLPAFKAILARCRTWVPREAHIFTGLPLHIFEAPATHQQVSRVITEWLSPYKVTLIPQGFGAFCSLLAEDDTLESQRLAIVDIGMRTTELVGIMRTQCVPQRSRGLVFGIRELLQDIAAWTTARVGRVIDDYEIDGVIQETRPLTIRGQVITPEFFADPFQQAKAHWMKKLEREIHVLWGANTEDFDQLIFTGGGAHLLREELLSLFPYSRILDQATWANAKGYLAYGAWQYPNRQFDHPTSEALPVANPDTSDAVD